MSEMAGPLREIGIDELLNRLVTHKMEVSLIEDTLTTRARLKEYTEHAYGELLALTQEGMALLEEIKPRVPISAEWIERRDDLLQRARRRVLDE